MATQNTLYGNVLLRLLPSGHLADVFHVTYSTFRMIQVIQEQGGVMTPGSRATTIGVQTCGMQPGTFQPGVKDMLLKGSEDRNAVLLLSDQKSLFLALT